METSLCTCGHPAHIFACWGDNGECACREHAVPGQKLDTLERILRYLILDRIEVEAPSTVYCGSCLERGKGPNRVIEHTDTCVIRCAIEAADWIRAQG